MNRTASHLRGRWTERIAVRIIIHKLSTFAWKAVDLHCLTCGLRSSVLGDESGKPPIIL